MKKLDLDTTRDFSPMGMKSIVLHDSEHFKILNLILSQRHSFRFTPMILRGSSALWLLKEKANFWLMVM